MFTAFNRLAKEGSQTEGTGIGLTITSQIIRLMNGEIGFSSVENEGSTFWFELPIANREYVAVHIDKENDKFDLLMEGDLKIPNSTLLYVEDNQVNQALMVEILARLQGLRVLLADSAETGLHLARRECPDLILMDIDMPDMTGIEALKILKMDHKTRQIPVIAVSANAMPLQIRNAMDAGFDQYLAKPLAVKDVLKAVVGRLTHYPLS